MSLKKENNYFDIFVELIDYSCKSANILKETLSDFNPEAVPHVIRELHTIEHTADIAKHDMMEHLIRKFGSPMAIEDIVSLSQKIDDVTDSIEDVMMRIHMYHIKTIRPEAIKFIQIIIKCCEAVKEALIEFPNFRKSTTIHDKIIEINRLEEDGDNLYSKVVYDMYGNTTNPIELVTWTVIFDCLEKCCDACEEVANDIDIAIRKNS